MARAINNDGAVTGIAFLDDFTHRAFVYTSSQGMVDLNSLIDPVTGWTLFDALAISDTGQITGYGLTGGETHAYLLTPVPEPTTSTLCFVIASVGIFGRRAVRNRVPR
jgi:probable HAF family extracellular repeat protein